MAGGGIYTNLKPGASRCMVMAPISCCLNLHIRSPSDLRPIHSTTIGEIRMHPEELPGLVNIQKTMESHHFVAG